VRKLDPARPLALTLDGQLVSPTAPALPPLERGYTCGDGLFETIPAPGGRPYEADRHWARLAASATALGLPVPPGDALARALEATLAAAGDATRVVRLTWSRGTGGRGYASGAAGPPRLVVSAWPLPGLAAAGGVRAVSVRGVTPGELARHKTLSAIHYVVAADRARAAGADEALLVDPRGRVLESAGANVFAVLGGRVVTPPASLPLFAGIGRARALQAIAERGEGPALEQAFDLAALARAAEAFLVSALRGVVPLVSIDGQPIGGGAPGALTSRLTPLPGSV
jgi:branched-chain amino acid aminotransferase